jgi:hypothetical protein
MAGAGGAFVEGLQTAGKGLAPVDREQTGAAEGEQDRRKRLRVRVKSGSGGGPGEGAAVFPPLEDFHGEEDRGGG